MILWAGNTSIGVFNCLATFNLMEKPYAVFKKVSDLNLAIQVISEIVNLWNPGLPSLDLAFYIHCFLDFVYVILFDAVGEFADYNKAATWNQTGINWWN